MELSEYAINDKGDLVYIPPFRQDKSPRTYMVWGISKWGFVHGVGSYINRHTYHEDCVIHQINSPSYEEIVKYYEDLNRFRNGRNDK